MYLQSLLQQNQNYSDEETEGPGSGRGTPVRERSTKIIAKVHLRAILLLLGRKNLGKFPIRNFVIFIVHTINNLNYRCAAHIFYLCGRE